MPRPLTHADTWIFDLDNTLYPASCRLFEQIDRNIGSYIGKLLGVGPVEARRVQKEHFRRHGTSLRGLMLEHGVDPHDFMSFVHDIDLSGVPRNLQLGAAIAALPGRKVVFTNGSVRHAQNVLAHLGLDGHFPEVFDIEAAGWVPKPEPKTYAMLVDRFAIDPRRAVMVEDMARNLEPAAAMGMATVLVRNESDYLGIGAQPWEKPPYVDHVVDDLAAFLLAAAAAEEA
jgi:putative hydrolase of the HAD superfamily